MTEEVAKKKKSAIGEKKRSAKRSTQGGRRR